MFDRLVSFLERLDRAGIHHELDQVRDAVMGKVAVPGERWEVEFFADGEVEVEIFRSQGSIRGEEALADLFADDTDAAPST